MIVTDKEFFMEKLLVEKLDLMIKRMNGTDDNVLNCTGDEGQGKSNIVSGICYYVAFKTGRKYSVDNIFFDLDKLISFASSTKEQIIHWDEGALGGLSMQWWKKNQQKFIQLLMIARKKKHFIVICIPKFYKLNEYIVVDRSIALIHVYSRENIHKGRFFYYTKAQKENLFNEWKRSHRKCYNKYKSFGGSFLEYMKIVFNEEEQKQYEDKKDEAILSLSKEEVNSPKSDRFKEQRDRMICFIKDKLNLPSNKLEEELEKYDIEMSDTYINRILSIYRKPQTTKTASI